MPQITETSVIKKRIEAGSGITDLEFFALEIIAWKKSDRRRDQILGEQYYNGEHDILNRKRTVIGSGGEVQEVKNLPNNKVVDNQYGKMVDQKTNYLLGKPLMFDCQNKTYADKLTKFFNKRVLRTLRHTGTKSLNGGIGWWFFYYGADGKPCVRAFPAYEILPFWADDEHTTLDCAARLYVQEVWSGRIKKTVERVELYLSDGIHRYILDGFTLVPDPDLEQHEPYFKIADKGKATPYNWDKIPLIAFKYNSNETPLISRVKSLQDGINTMLSDFENNMQEDARNTILVIKNYDGEDLGEFRRNLATYGAVKVRSSEGGDGGVETLTVEVNAENYKAILEVFKKALIENARGYDAKDDRLTGNPNQMNIQSMYSDIDLDANGMETEYQAAFEELLWFLHQHFINTGEGDFEGEDVTVVFNRDILINETESIDNCRNSVGILSEETIVGQHPWTVDVEDELKRIKSEKETAMQEYEQSFLQGSSEGGGLIAQ